MWCSWGQGLYSLLNSLMKKLETVGTINSPLNHNRNRDFPEARLTQSEMVVLEIKEMAIQDCHRVGYA